MSNTSISPHIAGLRLLDRVPVDEMAVSLSKRLQRRRSDDSVTICYVVRTTIGKELPTRYEIVQELPSSMLALLMQLNEREEE